MTLKMTVMMLMMMLVVTLIVDFFPPDTEIVNSRDELGRRGGGRGGLAADHAGAAAGRRGLVQTEAQQLQGAGEELPSLYFVFIADVARCFT